MTDRDAAFHLLLQRVIGDLAEAQSRRRIMEYWSGEWITDADAMIMLAECDLMEPPPHG